MENAKISIVSIKQAHPPDSSYVNLEQRNKEGEVEETVQSGFRVLIINYDIAICHRNEMYNNDLRKGGGWGGG